MRDSLSILALLALCIVLSIATGCGRTASVAVVNPAETGTGPLRVDVNQADGAEATSIDLVGLAEAERREFANLSPTEQSTAMYVFVVRDGVPKLPAVAGEYSVAGNAIRFTPRYPLARGMRYQVAIDRNRLANDPSTIDRGVSLEFATAAAAATPPTTLAQIYPSGQQLPENQLKFYLHFSAPMSRGEAYRHIHLLDGEGTEMEAVFLELGEELWDPGLQRFTLLCDPGRVKRGLVPREELGSVLHEGKDYTLVIDGDWRDAGGKPLAQEFRKAFHVIAPDHSPIETADWKIEAPKAGSLDPLIVNFPEPLDHSLLLRMLRVKTSGGESVVGAVRVSEAETRWQFTSAEPWQAGDYNLVVETTLEDLAGNSIGRAFDTDTSAPQQSSAPGATTSIPFSAR